ncbi:hypothetical protein ATANTOWER_014866 [Ataeniobius toweri]|uniref:Uncharacterized protein n=1 Tax=Ataeniobius toweri TaxID=208326 RepID=A0ABU7CGR4_9TELE|nr:hypothetical protein [Ataeniobius toweri]
MQTKPHLEHLTTVSPHTPLLAAVGYSLQSHRLEPCPHYRRKSPDPPVHLLLHPSITLEQETKMLEVLWWRQRLTLTWREQSNTF